MKKKIYFLTYVIFGFLLIISAYLLIYYSTFKVNGGSKVNYFLYGYNLFINFDINGKDSLLGLDSFTNIYINGRIIFGNYYDFNLEYLNFEIGRLSIDYITCSLLLLGLLAYLISIIFINKKGLQIGVGIIEIVVGIGLFFQNYYILILNQDLLNNIDISIENIEKINFTIINVNSYIAGSLFVLLGIIMILIILFKKIKFHKINLKAKNKDSNVNV